MFRIDLEKMKSKIFVSLLYFRIFFAWLDAVVPFDSASFDIITLFEEQC